jgi:hypothetical protein
MSVSKIEWVALSIITCIVVTYITVQTTAPSLQTYINKHKSSLNLTELKDLNNFSVNNGDLIFFCGDTRGERSCRWFTGSIYSHVGMLFNEEHPQTGENVIYVWEADVGHSSKRGPRVIELINKLKRYHGFPYFMIKKLVKGKVLLESILRVVDEYKNYEFDDSMISWWLSGYEYLHSFVKKDNEVFCSELIAMTMQSLHIKMMNTTKLPSWYSPGTFALDHVVGLSQLYSYGQRSFFDFSSIK